MSVKPVEIDATGVQVLHEEAGHAGTVPWADVDFPKRRDGTPQQYAIVLPCPAPGCDAESRHPVTGGADRPLVQELMARYYQRRAAALGLDAATIEKARELVAKRADELEGRATGRGG